MNYYNKRLVYFPSESILLYNISIVLYTKCKEVKFPLCDKVKECIKEMRLLTPKIEGPYHKNVLGIAANQYGYDYRIILLSKYPKDPKLRWMIYEAIINPEIIELSEEKIALWEGCVSDDKYLYGNLFYRNMLLKERPRACTVSYYDENGDVKIENLTDAKSRVFQHEIDHLEGKDLYSSEIIDTISLERMSEAEFFKDWVAIEKSRGHLI